MSKVYIEMIKANKGDSFIINIENNKKLIRILVDGGSERNSRTEDIYYNIKRIISSNGEKKINGIIVTHIHDDHIGGILKLLNDKEMNKYLDINNNFFIIFNDLLDAATISYSQAIRLHQYIEKLNIKLIKSYSNAEKIEINGFNIYISTVRTSARNKTKPLIKDFENDININLLLPIREEENDVLKEIMKNWKKENSKLINKSSIVFILEYKNKNVLLTGDSYINDIDNELENINFNGHIELLKIPHHGAYENNKNLEKFLKKYECNRLMLLTCKTQKHPDKEIIDKINKNNKIVTYCPYKIEEINNLSNEMKIFI